MSSGEHLFPPGSEPGPSAELQQYLVTHEALEPVRILDASYVPAQLGGPDSPKAVWWDEANIPRHVADFLPSSATDPRLRHLRHQYEMRADANVPAAVYETYSRLSEADRADQPFSRIFIPDTVNPSATGYMHRLTRLAQDTGLPVIVPVRTDNVLIYETLNPPYAESADDFWDNSPYNETKSVIEPEVSVRELLDRFLSVFAAGDVDVSPAIKILAQQDEKRLQQLPEHAAEACEKAIGILHAYATASGPQVPREQRAAARVVLAKLRDSDCLHVMGAELDVIAKRQSSGNEIVYPMGYYMRDNPEAFEDVRGRATMILAAKDGYRYRNELHALLNIMTHADAVACGEFMTGLLTEALADVRSGSASVIDRVLSLLPEVMQRARNDSVPPHAEREQLIQASESRIAHFLDALLEKRAEQLVRVVSWDGQLETKVAEGLIDSPNPQLAPCLRRYMRWLFIQQGSLITDPLFAKTYCKFRRNHGDLAEVSSRIYPAPVE